MIEGYDRGYNQWFLSKTSLVTGGSIHDLVAFYIMQKTLVLTFRVPPLMVFFVLSTIIWYVSITVRS